MTMIAPRAAIDDVIGKGGVILGSAITAQGVTDVAGAIGTVLGVVIAIMSIWLLAWRLKLNRLEREQQEMKNEKMRREAERDDNG